MKVERQGIMLAYPLTERKIARRKEDYLYAIQPKLNGERAKTVWFGNLPYLVSSYANEFQSVQHINKAIEEQIEPGIKLDGELYYHGMRLEDIHSIVSRKVTKHNNAAIIQYHVFDIADPTMPQIDRLKKLESLNLKPPLFCVPTNSVKASMDRINDAMIYWVNEGYEGVVVRTWDNRYIEARSVDMLKWKPKEEDTYTIVGVKEGEGWAQGMLGAFIVVGDDGTQFSVGTGALLTKAERQRLWKHRDALPGKGLLVRHEPMKTVNGIPKCTSAHKLIEDTTFQASIVG